ncbi:MAG TPA: PQQ-dependent sugar dehydrogenase [Vicinamibacterales bacterium]|nr:PQQ-dependent sugar dehydrogenase [Vicinamibacterales bacterium]
MGKRSFRLGVALVSMLWLPPSGGSALAWQFQPPAGQPTGGSEQTPPGQGRGRGGRGGNPAAALYAQHCASCHGPKLEGGAASSLLDEMWKFGGDDASITASIRDGRPGTAMIAFKDILDDLQIRQLVFHIREQAGLAKGRPETKVDPQGAIVKSEKATLRFEVVARDLETPWGLAFLPDGRLLITERPGRLRIVENGRMLPPVTGIPEVWHVQDGGLFDVEVHPQYAKNGWIYLSLSESGPDKTSNTVIIRGRIKDNAWVDQQVLFKGPPETYTPQNFHYGSRFAFDAQGHLYYSIGDKGRPEDAQDLSKPAGKIHRVNDDGSVPKDNPFVNRPDALGSIWSYGHRNPQGLAFDSSGRLWASEHGPRGGDELNLIEPGKNYGWAVVSNGLQPGITKSEQEGMESPVVHWTPTIAPAGIAVSSSPQYPGWKGSLFVTGLGGQQLRRLEVSGRTVTHQEVVFNEYGRVRDIITGPDGLFYVSLSLPGQRLSDTTAGVVVRMVPVP